MPEATTEDDISSLNEKKRFSRISDLIDEGEQNALSETLEHLVRVGSSNRHAVWRQEQHKRRKLQQDTDVRSTRKLNESSRIGSDTEDDEKDYQSLPVLEGHAEDVRLYGFHTPNRIFEPKPWPQKGFKRAIQPVELNHSSWEYEYGDGIDPVHFSDSHLSQHLPGATRSEISQTTTAGFTFPPSERHLRQCTLRSFILQCWNRAVHAVSTVIHANVNESTERARDFLPQYLVNPSTPSSLENEIVREKIRKYCVELGPRWVLPKRGSLACPICKSQAVSYDSLQEHFYGKNGVHSCAWIWLERRQRQHVAKVLEQDALCQLEQLFSYLFSKSSREHTKQLNWQDIIETLQDALEASKLSQAGEMTSAVTDQDTLLLQEQSLPIVMNQLVLDAARRRLIDRYTKVPR